MAWSSFVFDLLMVFHPWLRSEHKRSTVLFNSSAHSNRSIITSVCMCVCLSWVYPVNHLHLIVLAIDLAAFWFENLMYILMSRSRLDGIATLHKLLSLFFILEFTRLLTSAGPISWHWSQFPILFGTLWTFQQIPWMPFYAFHCVCVPSNHNKKRSWWSLR